MAKNGFSIIDSDMHIMEPPDLWERYIDAEFKSMAPIGMTSENVRDLGVYFPDRERSMRGARTRTGATTTSATSCSTTTTRRGAGRRRSSWRRWTRKGWTSRCSSPAGASAC